MSDQSPFMQAIDRDALRCVRCDAMNRPGHHPVTVESDAGALYLACDQCGHREPLVR
jgi:DNA-directed RNA polymerase subunit RPC12/RpoP